MEYLADGQATVTLPGRPTLTKTTDLAPIVVKLPRVYGISVSAMAFWFSTTLIGVGICVHWIFEIKDILRNYLVDGVFVQYSVLLVLKNSILSIFVFCVAIFGMWNLFCAAKFGRSILKIYPDSFIDFRISDEPVDWCDVDSAEYYQARYTHWVRLRLKGNHIIRVRGLQALRRLVRPRLSKNEYIIEINSMAGDKETLVQLILHLVNAAQANAAKTKPL